jgi:hypothetical protein
MDFNLKFFVIAFILVVVAGVPNHISRLLYLILLSPMELISWYNLALSPIELCLVVFLPFIVVYNLGKSTNREARLRPIVLAIFFGCWIGGVLSFAIDEIIQFSRGGTYGPFLLAVWLITSEIVWLAFSLIFFVSLAAVLLAFYQRRVSTPPPLPPTS